MVQDKRDKNTGFEQFTRSDLKSKLMGTLEEYVLKPDEDRSQNFCIDPSLLKYLTDFSQLNRKDVVLEVGGGLGFLTVLLARKVERVITVEIDPKLALLLERAVKLYRNVEVINADILKIDLGRLDFDCVVSNPPYKISSPLIFKIMQEKPVKTVMTLQKEFVNHVVAVPGDKNYTKLSVMISFLATASSGRIFPPGSFLPAPEVDSQVVKIIPRSCISDIPIEAVKGFRLFLNAVFMRKHKKNKK